MFSANCANMSRALVPHLSSIEGKEKMNYITVKAIIWPLPFG